MKTVSCWRTSNTGLDRQPVKAGAQAVPRFRRAINLKQFRRYYHADSAMFAERLARRRQKGKPDVCIAQLALPVAQSIFWHHRNFARYGGVGFLNFCRRVAGNDPAIQFLCGIRFKADNVAAQNRATDRRIVPEKAIAAG